MNIIEGFTCTVAST